MTTQNWIKRWKTMVAPSKIPNVWKRKDGGHLVRARIVDPSTGKMKEIKRSMPDADEATAYKWLSEEKARVRAGIPSEQRLQTRFADFAASLVEAKVKSGDIKSAKGRQRWKYTLEHLIAGTSGTKSGLFVTGFGEFFIDRLDVSHVEEWRASIGQLIAAGDYSPNTCNGWLSILRVIMKAAKRRFRLPHLATEDVADFDVSEVDTYSDEEPNALLPNEVGAFLEAVRDQYPQYFAMTFLGITTGLRPSSLRPLRRTGENADIDWEAGQLRVRRSQTVGDEVMETTKQKRKYKIALPEAAMDVLRWHVRTQLTTPEQQDSVLLFPSVTGGFRTPSVLNEPFADVAEQIKLGKKFTQRGLRRTFNDLARIAQVHDVVTRSISGHLTERMQGHYSTANGVEQREGIARVIELASRREESSKTATIASSSAGGAPSGAPSPPGGAPKEKAG